MSAFRVSVIIPVFNAEKYLRNAVESAVVLEEVGEVILIEDKSPDNALQLCNQLAKEFDKVRLLTHPNGENRGAGESRNLGIRKSTLPYVAFLDADDWYLPNRFTRCKEVFQNNNKTDGVYEATGYYYEETQQLDLSKLTTVKSFVDPGNLLVTLLKADTGRFHTNAITLKKTIFKKAGMFDPVLRLHQDTHLWLRLAHIGRLVPGEINRAVAVRRVHVENRIRHFDRASRNLLFVRTYEWFRKQEGVDKRSYRIIFNRYVAALKKNMPGRIFFTLIYLLRNSGEFRKLI